MLKTDDFLDELVNTVLKKNHPQRQKVSIIFLIFLSALGEIKELRKEIKRLNNIIESARII